MQNVPGNTEPMLLDNRMELRCNMAARAKSPAPVECVYCSMKPAACRCSSRTAHLTIGKENRSMTFYNHQTKYQHIDQVAPLGVEPSCLPDQMRFEPHIMYTCMRIVLSTPPLNPITIRFQKCPSQKNVLAQGPRPKPDTRSAESKTRHAREPLSDPSPAHRSADIKPMWLCKHPRQPHCRGMRRP